MDNLNTLVRNYGTDHQISKAEAQVLDRTAGGDAGKLTKAFEAQGVSHDDAARLATQVLVASHQTTTSSTVAVNFPVSSAPLTTGARAEREMPALGAKEMVSFTGDRDATIALLRGATQVNKIAGALGGDDCGGAAAVGALIADSITPEAAQANSKALRQAVTALGVSPTPAQETALKHLAEGRMSVSDVQHLQVMTYTAGLYFDTNSTGGGLSTGMEAGLVGLLRANGGLANSDVDFNINTQTVHGSTRQTAHWTADVRNAQGNLFINTWSNDGKDRTAIVTGQVGAHGKASAGWAGTIHTSSASQQVTADYVQPGAAASRHAEFSASGATTQAVMTQRVISAITAAR